MGEREDKKHKGCKVMKRIRLIVASILMLSIFVGCGARMEHLPGSLENSQYGPVNPEEQYGLISYLNAGATSVKAARKEDAYKQMHTACNGKYRIVNKEDKNTGAVFISDGSGGGYMANTNRTYIKFLCVDTSKTEVKTSKK